MTRIHTQNLQRLALIGIAAAFALLLAPKASQAMTISPPMLDLTLNPGDVVADIIQVYNGEGVPFKIRPVPVNFYVKEGDETTGAPDFYDADEVRTGYELATWFEFSEEPVVIPPDERVNIPIFIRVPADAQPGSHFGGIQILATKPDEVPDPQTSSVGIERATTVLIFVRVNGDLRDEVSIPAFGPETDFSTHLPVDFAIRVVNSGTTHQRPVGNVIIENAWGRRVASLQVNPGPQYKSVLPGSARRFDVSWFRKRLPDGASEYERQMSNFAFGRYTATLLLNYGSDKNQKHLTAATTFWVVPWMALLTIAGVLIVLLLIVFHGLEGYNKMVIRRYENLRKHGKV